MTELEQQIIGIISAAGDSKGKAFEALRKVKESDYEGARALLEESRKIDLEAHKIQTKLIQSEMDPEAEKPELSLLMVHAQDHYMTSQLARDVIEALVSTNMLMQNMKKVVKESAKLNEEDFKFTAIPADSLEEEIDNWDVVLVGPQVSHKIDFIEAVCKPKNVPFAVIDKDVYGQMDGATVLKLALVTRKKHEMGK